MRIRTLFILIFSFLGLILIPEFFGLDAITAIRLLVDYIIFETNKVKSAITAITAFLGVFMAFKLRFYDNKKYRKLQMTIGKHLVLKSLEILAKFLKDGVPPGILTGAVERLTRDGNDLKLHMFAALQGIHTAVKSKEPQFKIRWWRRWVLYKEVKKYIKLINVQFEAHYMSEDIKKKAKKTRELDEQLKKKGKDKLLALEK